MPKATKATRKRLHDEDFSPRNQHAALLEFVLMQASTEGNKRAFYAIMNDKEQLFYLCYPDEAPLFAGLKTKYPSLIETTLTHGNNEIIIPDINKLVKAMLNNR